MVPAGRNPVASVPHPVRGWHPVGVMMHGIHIYWGPVIRDGAPVIRACRVTEADRVVFAAGKQQGCSG